MKPKLSALQIAKQVETKPAAYWAKLREQNALNLFHTAAERVPAYKDFLKKNKVSPDKVKTFADFQLVPTVSKKDYLKQYPLEKLCWDGTLKTPLVFTSTSGSTGEPFYFPRGHQLDWQYSSLINSYLRNSSLGINKSTFVLIGFGMGVWIGGLITYQAFEIAGRENSYPASILTPGINKVEIFKALRQIAPNYEQTVIVGYPPFIKDIVDEAKAEGVDLKKLNTRFLFAAEAFPEKLRDHFKEKAGIRNVCRDTLNIYGTADIGAMAFETPTSIMIRRLAIKDKSLFEKVFSSASKTPTLAQYNPHFMTFEAPQGEVLLTGNNTIPLIRYAVGDHGGSTSFAEMEEKLASSGISIEKAAREAGISDCLYKLPFVHVYERTDFSTTLYGLQIYPETIREVLLEKPLTDSLTGKCTMITRFDKKHDQYLEINLELRKGKKANQKLEKLALHRIVTNLRHKNSEFRELSNYLGDRAMPKLQFWPCEDPLYFRPGVKQKWVKK